MPGDRVVKPMAQVSNGSTLPIGLVSALIDRLDSALLVSGRGGELLFINAKGRAWLEKRIKVDLERANLFLSLIHI